MSVQLSSREKADIADEIINNAIGLPVENQELLLMMAKAMQYTRNCVLRQEADRPASPASETDT